MLSSLLANIPASQSARQGKTHFLWPLNATSELPEAGPCSHSRNNAYMQCFIMYGIISFPRWHLNDSVCVKTPTASFPLCSGNVFSRIIVLTQSLATERNWSTYTDHRERTGLRGRRCKMSAQKREFFLIITYYHAQLQIIEVICCTSNPCKETTT